ncbi:chromosome segregation protein SMC [Vallicoccus soli]|uniref:Chromosome partition protein Smc n=1 Tax=Vallicoccus soli TaxID=2339232 RepID=A0A3A3ZNL1_9ACTN|nr:chromosome segregation protein SMC [Vallicoccus soli]
MTLKGFKSFASATTLRFEPGITCVVGPNGSGKSNVIDALAWVMGEQGAKSLRGGKMEDVIFAGTAGRPPLGRAEVSLTIDNTDGALPIEYSEVTITRTMFRNGGSDYAINGQSCRLLDVQELLSDSGIGREMHVIVGQGQLDSVLSASPEERRGFVEEAAGVLKHRKRKEKALRKLDAMQANLTRVQDLTAELRRQLGPLGRQAELARRAATVQADARDARSRLLADDLVQLRSSAGAGREDRAALQQRREEAERALAAVAGEQRALEEQGRDAAPRLARAQQTWFELSALRERLRGTAGLARERLRAASAQDGADDPRGRDPEELERSAARVREEEAALTAEVAALRGRLEEALAQREAAERAFAEEDRRVVAAARAAADRREGLARLRGTVDARRSRVEAGEAEAGRLGEALAGAAERARRAQQDYAALETQVAGLDEGEEDLDAAHEDAAAALGATEERLAALRVQEQEAERERAAATARRDALRQGLVRDGTGALLGATDGATDGAPRGVLGTVAQLLEVEPGHEAVVAAALGAVADGVAVADAAAAAGALAALRGADAGRAALLVGGGAPGAPGAPAPALAGGLPAGARPVLELVTAPDGLAGAVRRLLGAAVAVEDLDAARALVAEHPALVAVTSLGDVLGSASAAGGAGAGQSLLEVQAAVDAAEAAATEAAHRCERLRFELGGLEEERRAAAERVEASLERLHESDARMSAVAEQLAQLGGAVRAAGGETQRLERAREAALTQLAADREALAGLQERLAAAEAAPDEGEPGHEERDRLSAVAVEARRQETELRLAARTAEERVKGLGGRAEGLERAARQEREARARAARRRARRLQEVELATAVATATARVLEVLDRSLTAAAAARDEAEASRGAREGALGELRRRERALGEELERLVDAAHRDEVARTEHRLRTEALEQRIRDELGVDPDVLVEEHGPHRPVPLPRPEGEAGAEGAAAGPHDDDAEPRTAPYVRAEQEKRLRTAERALARLGRVNPLALEEFAALEERHRFLVEQLEDLKSTRRDLLDIVAEVDARVQEVFAAAYEDTAREFEHVFARLFPGGEGRLVLTQPDDMLATGIEVEARPPGKKVKRLSLLSGGERSLTAVALLVAIFKARPSPFYVMDEVEAALDDTNLGRLLVILEELRASSQLIVITHQKRTMEVADALYGVSMRGDGVTTVISQRLREPGEAPAAAPSQQAERAPAGVGA